MVKKLIKVKNPSWNVWLNLKLRGWNVTSLVDIGAKMIQKGLEANEFVNL